MKRVNAQQFAVLLNQCISPGSAVLVAFLYVVCLTIFYKGKGKAIPVTGRRGQ
jgi:hypothetical protein